MRPKELRISDKKLINKFLKLRPHELSVYSFENIYIWKGLYRILWLGIEDCLLIFFKDRIGCFLYLAPLAKENNKAAVNEAFKIMDSFNQNREISRIENAEENDLLFYRTLGYEYKRRSDDYICKRNELVELKGNRFKSKRACLNHFVRHYKFEYLPFSLRYKGDCLKLYEIWMSGRKENIQDALYRGMLEDSFVCFKTLLRDFGKLNLTGRIVRINGRIKAFSFGFALNEDTFCILYEITDLSVKGLSQFIFRQFCSELRGYKYINIMDDSGLENLKKVKLSYRPIKLAGAYVVKRKNDRKEFRRDRIYPF